jgi:hypothetical protein
VQLNRGISTVKRDAVRPEHEYAFAETTGHPFSTQARRESHPGKRGEITDRLMSGSVSSSLGFSLTAAENSRCGGNIASLIAGGDGAKEGLSRAPEISRYGKRAT